MTNNSSLPAARNAFNMEIVSAARRRLNLEILGDFNNSSPDVVIWSVGCIICKCCPNCFSKRSALFICRFDIFSGCITPLNAGVN